MKSTARLLVVAVAVLGFNSYTAQASDVTPVQKVITLLQGMLEKGKKEKADEEVQFSAYNQWCTDTSTDKKNLIAEAAQTIDNLKASIQSHKVEAARLDKEVVGHQNEIAGWKSDTQKSVAVRADEKDDYDALHKDYSESIDALDRAMAVLKKQAHNRKQASLIEVQAVAALALVPTDAKNVLNVFLQNNAGDSDDELTVSGPETHGYQFQSQGVIDMLAKLYDKFVDERNTLENKESNSQHQHDMFVQDLSGSIQQGNDDISDKSASSAIHKQKQKSDETDLQETQDIKAADEHFLKNTQATCAKKASDFEARAQLRAEELVAIQQAIDIMSGNAVSGAADKHLPAFTQSAFAQLRANAQAINQEQAAEFLATRAQALNSRILAAMSEKVSGDPFVKVKRLIQDLVTRLESEAADEADHKAWCDTELKKNKATRDDKTSEAARLMSEIDQHQSNIEKLSQEIAETEKNAADLRDEVAKATKLRADEKAENEATIKDAKAAQAATQQAIEILRDFYEKAGRAVSLAQAQPTPPPIFDDAYQGQQSEHGGVVAMLDVILTDFARLESETTSDEQTAQDKFNDFKTDSEVSLAEFETNINHRTKKRANHNRQLSDAKEDQEGNQENLDAANAYFDKLKPSCIDASVPYDQRVAHREEEIQSLEEALKILSGEDIA